MNILRAGAPVNVLQLSNTATGRRQAEGRLTQLLGMAVDREAIATVLGRIFAWAAGQLATAPKVAASALVYGVVRARVPAMLKLTYRADRGGIWSETQGRDFTRADFLAFTPYALLEEVADQVEGAGGPLEMLSAVKAALEVTWADLVRALPRAAGAALGSDSQAAARCRAAIARLWKAPRTFEVPRTGGPEADSIASRASLLSRVRSQRLRGDVRPNRGGWRRIHDAADAWWREHTTKDGEVQLWLAMRYDLAAQVGVELPEATDQGSLTILGERYGVLEQNPPVPDRMTGGGRLAVLSRQLTDELLQEAGRDETE